MFCNLFPLAVQSTLRKKRSSGLILATLALTFAFAIVTLSLVESIGKTNEAYRLQTFGEWYLAIPDGKEEDEAWLAQQDWAEKVGTARSYGRAARTGELTFGTVDEAYIGMAGIELRAGHLPTESGEIAVEARVLEKLGYDETAVGQTVTVALGARLPISDDDALVLQMIANGKIESTDTGSLFVSFDKRYTFTLCGVLEDYSDLWNISNNKENNRPPCVLMTEETARESLSLLNEYLQKNYPTLALIEPNRQYYIGVSAENRQLAAKATEEYMRSTRDFQKEDISPCVNNATYPVELETNVAPDRIYPALIAAVALVAVLCVYLMNLPAEVHSFAVLRSIGITKGQLLTLMGLESLILAVPAVLLGIPLGALLTKLALRLLVYSDSVPVQTTVPYDALELLLVLWLAVILLARLIVFFITVRTPLTGRMQMRENRARASGRFRRALIALLLIGFTSAVLYVAAESYSPTVRKQTAEAEADYVFAAAYQYAEGSGTATSVPISYSAAERLAELPGVSFAEGYMSLLHDGGGSTALAFTSDSMEEQIADFFVMDETRWASALNLSEEETRAFHAGDFVLLIPPTGMQQSTAQEVPQEITLYALENGACVGTTQAAVKLWQQPTNMSGRYLPLSTSYTVIASQAYLEKLVAELEPGKRWGCFVGGEEAGYATLWLTCTEQAGDLSINYAIKEVCQQEGLALPEDNRKEKQANIQTCAQELLLLYACGGCVALVTLLLLASALALEAEQERRSYSILRVIGMSLRQMRRRVFGKALWRGAFAVAVGWTLVTALDIRKRLEAYSEFGWTLKKALELVPADHLALYGSRAAMTALLAAMLAVLLAVSLLAKRGLKQTTLLK